MHISNFLSSLILLLSTIVYAAPLVHRSDNATLTTREPTIKHIFQAAHIALKIKAKLKPPANGAVFWSGKKHGPTKGKSVTVINDAQKYAQKHGKQTLEMGLANKKINIPKQEHNPHSYSLWKIASKAWAQRAKGEVHMIHGHQVKDKGIWKTIEKPALLKNKQVTKITEHNIDTKKHVVTKGK